MIISQLHMIRIATNPGKKVPLVANLLPNSKRGQRMMCMKTQQASGWASALRGNLTSTANFKTRIESCRWKVCAEVGPFCRKGLRSVAATCDHIPVHFKIMSSEITAPLFVSPCNMPLTLRRTAKILSGRKDLLKSPKRIARQTLFHTPPGVAQPTGFLNKCLELRLEWLAPPQAHSARLRSLISAPRPHSRSQSLICSASSALAAVSRCSAM